MKSDTESDEISDGPDPISNEADIADGGFIFTRRTTAGSTSAASTDAASSTSTTAATTAIAKACANIDRDMAERLRKRLPGLGLFPEHAEGCLLSFLLGIAQTYLTVAALDGGPKSILLPPKRCRPGVAIARADRLCNQSGQPDSSDLQPVLAAWEILNNLPHDTVVGGNKQNDGPPDSDVQRLALDPEVYTHALHRRFMLKEMLREDFGLEMHGQMTYLHHGAAGIRELTACLLASFPERLLRHDGRYLKPWSGGNEKYTLAHESRLNINPHFSGLFYLPTRRLPLPGRYDLIIEASTVDPDLLLEVLPNRTRLEYTPYSCNTSGVVTRMVSYYLDGKQIPYSSKDVPVLPGEQLDAQAAREVTMTLARHALMQRARCTPFFYMLKNKLTILSQLGVSNVPFVPEEHWVELAAKCLKGATSIKAVQDLPEEALIPTSEQMIEVLGKERAEQILMLDKLYPDKIVTSGGAPLQVSYVFSVGIGAEIKVRLNDNKSELPKFHDKDLPAVFAGHPVRIVPFLDGPSFLVDRDGLNVVRRALVAIQQEHPASDGDVLLVQVEQPGMLEKENVLLLWQSGARTYRPVLCQPNMTWEDRGAAQLCVDWVVTKFLGAQMEMQPKSDLISFIAKKILAEVKSDFSDLPKACAQESLKARLEVLRPDMTEIVKPGVESLSTLLAGSKSPREDKEKFRQLRSSAEALFRNPLKLLEAWTELQAAKEEAQRLLLEEKKSKQR